MSLISITNSYYTHWKPVAAFVYLVICMFDFVIVPAWIGLSRPSIHEILEISQSVSDLNPAVQLEVARALTHQHDPFTLQHGGLLHLAFGALLTGAALGRIDTPQRGNMP